MRAAGFGFEVGKRLLECLGAGDAYMFCEQAGCLRQSALLHL